jgi:hypothetical protein
MAAAEGGIRVIETTWKGGEGGDVWPYIEMALSVPDEEKNPETDWFIRFFPWWVEPTYSATTTGTVRPTIAKYLDHKEEEIGQQLGRSFTFTAGQRSWYDRREQEFGLFVKREYPTTLDECWEAPVEGAVYADLVAQALAEGRVYKGAYVPGVPVHTLWDLGSPENTVVWYWQEVAGQIRFIDCDMKLWLTTPERVKHMKAKGYVLGKHYLPHDASAMKTGVLTFRGELVAAGLEGTVVVPRTGDEDLGINRTRMMFPHFVFDLEKCALGLKSVKAYHYHKERHKAVHDWSSHACLAAGTMVETTRGRCPIEQVKVGDEVIVAGKTSRVVNAGMVGVKPLVEVVINATQSLRCTADHVIFTSRGLIEAGQLQAGDTIITSSCLQTLSHHWPASLNLRDGFQWFMADASSGFGPSETCMSTSVEGNNSCCIGNCGGIGVEKLLTVIRSSLLTVIGPILTRLTGKPTWAPIAFRQSESGPCWSSMALNTEGSHRATTWTAKANTCTEWFGKVIMGSYPKAFTSTTATMIDPTTRLPIWNFSVPQIIRGFMEKLRRGWGRQKIGRILRPCASKLPSGTGPSLEEIGTPTMGPNNGRPERKAGGRSKVVKCAERSTSRFFPIGPAFARQSAGVVVQTVRRLNVSEPVYDLTIEHDHCFVANGLVVSNCDALRVLAEAQAHSLMELNIALHTMPHEHFRFFDPDGLAALRSMVLTHEGQTVWGAIDMGTMRRVPEDEAWLKLWEAPHIGGHYLVSVVKSKHEREGDAVTVWKVEAEGRLREVAALADGAFDMGVLARWVAVLSDYYGKSMVVPVIDEASGLLEALQREGCSSIFARDTPRESRRIGQGKRLRKWGYELTPAAREHGLGLLQDAIREETIQVRSKAMVEQAEQFIQPTPEQIPTAAPGHGESWVIGAAVALHAERAATKMAPAVRVEAPTMVGVNRPGMTFAGDADS